jgi:segregation and condensation protein B
MRVPPQNLQAATEALLFASDSPMSLKLLSEALDTPVEQLTEVVEALSVAYTERSAGVELREIGGGWQLVTASDQADWVGRMLRGKRKVRLSRAALETLAIVAYKQPVTKSEIEAIRGVDSSGVMATLLERTLVTIRGRSKVVGRPLLYGTTQEFLEYFGLRELNELPRPEELKALVDAREPEQLDMMEVEVVAQVATDLAAMEGTGSDMPVPPEAADVQLLAGDDEYGEDELEDEDGDEEEDELEIATTQHDADPA